MKKINFLLFGIALIFSFASCKNGAVDEGNYARITLTQGDDDVYEFTLTKSGEDEIYAQRGTSGEGLDCFRIKCANGYEDTGHGYETLEITFVPQQKDSDGNTVEPYMTVVFYKFLHQDSYTSDVPEWRTFKITSDALFTKNNYSQSVSEDASLWCSWYVDEENAVNPSSTYTSSNSTVQRYQIKGVEFKATIKTEQGA